MTNLAKPLDTADKINLAIIVMVVSFIFGFAIGCAISVIK